MLRRLYNWVLGLARGPFALPVLAAVAFIDGSFFPMPPDFLLGPMVLARRDRAWLYAGVTTIASILGGMVGYGIGHFLAPVGMKLLAMTGHAGGLASFQALYAKIGLAVILLKGFTPVPYQLVSIASGIAAFSFPVFVAGSLVTRGARFFIEATLLQHPTAQAFVDKHLTVLFIAGIAAIIVILVIVERLH
jgi:membrane protein YqaA with SNARE-associated domain